MGSISVFACLLLLASGILSFNRATFTPSANQGGLRTADLDNDGLLDVVTTSTSAQYILAWFNNGTRSLPNLMFPVFVPMTYWAVPSSSLALQLADFNGDGLTDILCGYQNASGSGLAAIGVYLNRGNRNFANPSAVLLLDNSATWLLNEPDSVVATTLNNDTTIDLAVLGRNKTTGLGVIATFLNLGLALFGPPSYRPTTLPNPVAMVVYPYTAPFSTRVNCLAVLHLTQVQILVNDGTGVFTAFTPIVTPTGQTLNHISAVADFNLDGLIDFAYSGSGYFYVASNSANLNFNIQSYSISTLTGYRITAADYNADGFPDLALAFSVNGGVYLNTRVSPIPSFSVNASLITYGTLATTLNAADLNSDGRPDLIGTFPYSTLVPDAIVYWIQSVPFGPMTPFTGRVPLVGADNCNIDNFSCQTLGSGGCAIYDVPATCNVLLSTANRCFASTSYTVGANFLVNTSYCGPTTASISDMTCGLPANCNPFLCPQGTQCCSQCRQGGTNAVSFRYSLCASCFALQSNLNLQYTVRVAGSVVYPNSANIFELPASVSNPAGLAFSILNPTTIMFWTPYNTISNSLSERIGTGQQYVGVAIASNAAVYNSIIYSVTLGAPPPRPLSSAAVAVLPNSFLILVLIGLIAAWF